MNEMEALGQRIGKELGAEKTILLGSHAHAAALGDSDVDLRVVAETPRLLNRRYGAV